MEVLATSGMVLRDKKSSPRLIFDNPTHTHQASEGTPLRQGDKKEVRGTKSVSMVTGDTRGEERRLSLSGEVLDMFKGRARPASVKSTPEVDLEDHILENIRNRGFWTRKSSLHASSMRASHGNRLALPCSRSSTAPAHPKEPFIFPEPSDTDAPEEGRKAEGPEGEAGGQEEAAIDSAMMLEIQQEARLRDNITWMRQYLTQAAEADGGSFREATFHSALSNKVKRCTLPAPSRDPFPCFPQPLLSLLTPHSSFLLPRRRRLVTSITLPRRPAVLPPLPPFTLSFPVSSSPRLYSLQACLHSYCLTFAHPISPTPHHPSLPPFLPSSLPPLCSSLHAIPSSPASLPLLISLPPTSTVFLIPPTFPSVCMYLHTCSPPLPHPYYPSTHATSSFPHPPPPPAVTVSTPSLLLLPSSLSLFLASLLHPSHTGILLSSILLSVSDSSKVPLSFLRPLP